MKKAADNPFQRVASLSTNPLNGLAKMNLMAERVGFEPTVPAKAQRFSRPPRSATLAPLQAQRRRLIWPTPVVRNSCHPEKPKPNEQKFFASFSLLSGSLTRIDQELTDT